MNGEHAMPISRLVLITFPLLMTAAGLCRAEVHQHAHEEELLQMHGSHVHGEVILNIVLEEDRLDVEMISPAMNITGFEHAPSTEQERATLSEAIASNGLAIVPWGFGKWVGKRGKALRRALESVDSRQFFLGDNSGRPKFSPTPLIFR